MDGRLEGVGPRKRADNKARGNVWCRHPGQNERLDGTHRWLPGHGTIDLEQIFFKIVFLLVAVLVFFLFSVNLY